MKDIVKLGTLGDIFIGLTYRPEDVANEGTIVLRSSNIQNGKLDFADIVRVKCKVRENLIVKPNDILMCSRNGSAKLVGKCTLLPKMDEEMSFGAFMTIIRTQHNPYLVHFFNSNAFRGQLGSAATTTINQITRRMLDDISVPLYPKEQEDYIVSLFNQIDELIWTETQKLELCDELVKSRFIELFGDPETNPHKWPSSKLSEFCDLQNGYAFKSQDYLDNSKVLNCRMSNIRPDGGFDAEYHPKYLPDTFWEKYKEYRLVDGDVIIAMTDMASDPKILGVPTIVRTRGHKFLLNQRVGKLSFYDNKSINNVYLMFVLSQKNIRQQLVKSAGGSTQINVGKPAVLGVEFFVPPLVLQNQFAAFVEQTDKSKWVVQQSIAELEELKKSLMQKYFG